MNNYFLTPFRFWNGVLLLLLGVEGSAPVSNSRCYLLTNEAETIAGPDSSLGEVRTALLRLLSIWLVCQRVDTVTDYSPQSCARFIIGLLDLGQVRLLSHCFPTFCGIKKSAWICSYPCARWLVFGCARVRLTTEREKYLFHICKIACKNFDRRNGETPDKIGGFLGNIFFIAL